MQRVRFESEDPSHRLRIAVGSRLLIGGGSLLLSVLARLESRGTIHVSERTWAAATARLLRLRFDIEGLANADPSQQYVIVSLHEGFADVLALLQLPLPLRFLVRDELFQWAALGRYLRTTSQVPVTEAQTRSSLRRLYRQIEEVFDSGDSPVVFPQGSILGVEVGFQTGASRLAQRFSRPILPVVITGGHRVWEHPYAPTVRLDQRISMRVLPAISAAELRDTDFRGVERRMKGLALDPSTAPARRFVPERDGWWDGYRYEIDPDFPALRDRLASRRAGGAPRRTETVDS